MSSSIPPPSAPPEPQIKIALESKVIAITGANCGIGLGIAGCCLVNGAARIYSIDIGEAGEDFQALSQHFTKQLSAIQADVTQESRISAALFGAFYTARCAARAFIRLGIKGAIVFTTSMASYRPNKVGRVPSTPYGASKAGIRNMTHTLAMEWAQYGIRQLDWEQQLKYYGGFPRLAEVQELGGAYVYLLSDAASYTTSIDIPVNGAIGIC
ncbi:short chain alcohol dehydrogenase [Penicillium hispanicum]|uniref:short chain alcohol dehydrogenase n=1 Tax=Penicillium hispanicum TaxID=1080232 RepID=UPI002541D1C0|nr:short chain alcohol dehydrogenase [Penicillium hispanicum]KAJ5579734.1 short chain alcohol dehydrogenase [Penicillium hispanicum]